MSVIINDKINNQEILLAGKPNTDLVLNSTSENPIANKAVYNALAGKIENTVDNLINYYLKSDVYNKTETQDLIDAINGLTIEVVNALPVDVIKLNTIYFVGPDRKGGYKQYVRINNSWVSIGSTEEIDLSQYVTTTNLNLILEDYYTKVDVNKKVRAKAIPFDNSETDITSTNVEDAIKEVFLNAGAQVQEVTMAYYLAHKSELDASGDLIIVTDSGMANTAVNVLYDNTNSGLVAETVQGAIDEVRLIKVVGAVRTITLNASQTTWYGFYDPSGSTEWTGYNLNKLVTFDFVIDEFGTDNMAIPMGTWRAEGGYPAVSFVNRSTTRAQTLKYHIVAYFRP